MSYRVEHYSPRGVPRTARRGEPFRLIACHDTEGTDGHVGARDTIDWMVSTAAQRNASYHEVWSWNPDGDSFLAQRMVPASHASHSIAPQPTSSNGQPLYTPDAWVRASLGDGWSDPNYWIYAVALAGTVAQVDAWTRDARFLAHCRRRFGELRAELGVRARAEHFRFNPRTRSDWGRTLMAELGGLEIPDAGRFSDVPPDHPHFGDIEWLASAGISSGTGAGRFSPDAPVTRAQMAAFLRRFTSYIKET